MVAILSSIHLNSYLYSQHDAIEKAILWLSVLQPWVWGFSTLLKSLFTEMKKVEDHWTRAPQDKDKANGVTRKLCLNLAWILSSVAEIVFSSAGLHGTSCLAVRRFRCTSICILVHVCLKTKQIQLERWKKMNWKKTRREKKLWKILRRLQGDSH